MSIVVDCSFAAAWCFADQETQRTAALLREVRSTGMCVPAVWPLEVANVLLMAERFGRLTVEQRDAFLSILSSLAVEIEPGPLDHVIGNAMPLARKHRLTVYDASYLEMALRRRLPLATRDQELITAGESAGAELIRA